MSEEKMREKFEAVYAAPSFIRFDGNKYSPVPLAVNEENMEIASVFNIRWEAWQAALQEREAGAVGYIDEEGIFISVKAYNKVINVFKCLYTPVFLAPLSAQAIETAAIMKCAEVVRSLGEVKDSAYVEAFLALITQDGRTQLEQKCMEAQERTEKCIRDYFAFKSSMHPAQMQDLINELRRMAESTMEGEK